MEDLGHRQLRLVEQPADALAGEEPQMRRVQQADVLVVEMPLQERDPDASVSDVGKRDHEVTAWSEKASQPAQRAQRVPEMFQHIGSDDHVEAVRAQLALEVELVQVSDDQPLAVLGGASAMAGSSSIPTTVHPRSCELTRHVAGRRPQLQDPPIRTHQRDHARVSALGIQVDPALIAVAGRAASTSAVRLVASVAG